MKRWSSLFGALGLVGVLFGLLSVFLLLAGAPTDLRWIFANFVLGAVFIALWIVSSVDNLRERLSSGEARRVGRFGTSALLGTLASLVIVGLLGFLTTRYEKRFDWSEAQVHSLSEQTRNVLKGLERDVDVVAFYPTLEQQPVRELLERYRYESDRFQLTLADPTVRPDLVERYGIDPGKLAEGLVRIGIGEEAVEVDEPTEENLTNALVKLTRTGEKKVYFLEGHNERPVAGEGSADPEGFARAADALRNENYRFESLLLGARGEVPEDADVVVIAGPTRPLRPEEHRALERYVARGGSLLVLVDPRAKTDLVDDLEGWGVLLGDDVVVDRVQGLFGRATTPFASQYADHEITQGLREVTLFHVARSVRASDGAKEAYVELVKTGAESWGERDLDQFFSEGRAELGPDDVRGPVTIALAGSPPRAGGPEGDDEQQGASGADASGRIVVFGDSDFASNQLIEAYRNRDLFVNSVNWLLGDVEAIAVRPQRSRASRLQLSTEQLSNIRYLSLFVLPEAIAVLGVLAWWARRRAPGR